jgi:esterase/lipase superfamily enzyme
MEYIMAVNKVLLSALVLCWLTGCGSIFLSETTKIKQENLYRRIPYKIEGDLRVIDLFYASTRDREEVKGEVHFKPTLSSSLTFGTLQAKIDPLVRIGTVTPGKLKRREKIGVQDVEVKTINPFLWELKKAVAQSPHKSLLVLVFGYKDDFEITATKAAYFAYRLDLNTPVLLFDWPGDQPISPAGYLKAGQLASDAGVYLGELLADIVREVGPSKLWVQSTSLGCRVLCRGFEYLYRLKDFADPEPEIAHVLMTAPDVGEGEFNLRFKDAIASLTERLTVYVSSNDGALLVSEAVNREKRLGRQDERLLDQEQYEEARDLLYLKTFFPQRISIVDVTPINRSMLGHQYVLEAPEFFDDFYLRLFEASPHFNRRLYLVEEQGGVDYWILRDDKY